MSYCTITEIQALNPKRTYGALTTPTQTQVETFIDQIGAEIDTILEGRGYTTPVTALSTTTAFYNFIVALCARGASALAEQAMFPEAGGQMSTPAAQILWKQYQEGLKFLREGQLSVGTSGAVASLPFSFFEKNQAVEDEPTENYDWQESKFGINKDF